MKKILCGILIVIVCMINAGCNRQIIDTTFKYDRAIVALPNGDAVGGEVDSWVDFKDGDQIQVVIRGVSYLTHFSNVVFN